MPLSSGICDFEGGACDFDPPHLTPQGGETNDTRVTINTDATQTGALPLEVMATGGGLQRSAQLTVTITRPSDFTLSCSPSSLEVAPGSHGSSRCTVRQSGGETPRSVNLACRGLPSAAMCMFTPPTVNLEPGGTGGESALDVQVSPMIVPGDYPFQVVGTSAGLEHTFDMTLYV